VFVCINDKYKKKFKMDQEEGIDYDKYIPKCPDCGTKQLEPGKYWGNSGNRGEFPF
jgi:hypothetical protein